MNIMMNTFNWTTKLALKDIRNSRRFVGLFILTIAIGVVGFLLLETISDSIRGSLQSKSKAILAADLRISGARPLSVEETQKLREIVPADTLIEREISFVSMVTHGQISRIAEIRAIDKHFPLQGSITLKNFGIQNRDQRTSLTSSGTWLYPELLIQLDAKTGDKIQIGESSFQIQDEVSDDATASTFGFSFAPRVFIDIDDIEKTGLIKTGSRITYSTAILYPANIFSADKTSEQENLLATNIKNLFKNQTDLRVRSHMEASDELARAMTSFGDYLNLVALIAVFLAGFGAYFLFRSFLDAKSKDIATLLSLGATRHEARFVYIFSLLFMSLMAIAISSVMVFLALQFIPNILSPKIFQTLQESDIHLSLNMKSVLKICAIISIGSLVSCWPLLQYLGQSQTSSLLRDVETTRSETIKTNFLHYLPALVFCIVLCLIQVRSIFLTSVFLGSLLVIAGTVAFLAKIAIRPKQLRSQKWHYRLAWLNIRRYPMSSISCITSLAMISLLSTTILLLKDLLNSELSGSDQKRPSLFLFDIQDEQAEPLKNFLAEKAFALDQSSPMVRARLVAINGKLTSDEDSFASIEGTREREDETRRRERQFNLSSRAKLTDSETIIAGRNVEGIYEWQEPIKPAEATVEQRFAERTGLKVGSSMTFDVLGVELPAVVVGIRRVKWMSFQPNFFVQMQDGVFNETPKTWVAVISENHKLSSNETRMSLQSAVVSKFPNISIIDVRQTVKRLVDVSDRMAQSVWIITVFTILAGLATIFAIVRLQIRQRRQSVALLKTFGANFNEVQKGYAFEFLILSGLGVVLGASIALIFSEVLAQFIFHSHLVLSFGPFFLLVISILFISWLTCSLAVRSSLYTSTRQLLQPE